MSIFDPVYLFLLSRPCFPLLQIKRETFRYQTKARNCHPSVSTVQPSGASSPVTCHAKEKPVDLFQVRGVEHSEKTTRRTFVFFSE